jgi:hypothetical protein
MLCWCEQGRLSIIAQQQVSSPRAQGKSSSAQATSKHQSHNATCSAAALYGELGKYGMHGTMQLAMLLFLQA